MLYRLLAKPLLFRCDPEWIHNRAAATIAAPWLRPCLALYNACHRKAEPALATSFCGIPLSHPIGLAAGFDKQAHMAPGLQYLGFSHIEIGTITGQAQAGNPKPRLFRVPDDSALINRMGFNNGGADLAAKQLSRYQLRIPIGGNIGKTKRVPLEQAEDDYAYSFNQLRPYVDYFVVNVSSPNTPNLRQLQDREPLQRLLQRLMSENRTSLPILLKIAPDLTQPQLEDIARVVQETGIHGVIATNTTIRRDGLKTRQNVIEAMGNGGLSGAPIRERSTAVIRSLRSMLPDRVDIVGVGGIFSGRDAYEKICAGAAAVQIYTSFIYRGPATAFKIQQELSHCLKRDGFSHVRDAIGSAR